MQLVLDTNFETPEMLQLASQFLLAAANIKRQLTAQPAATPAEGVKPESNVVPIETAKKKRATKAEAPAASTVAVNVDSSAVSPANSAPVETKALDLADVRTALEAFMARNGENPGVCPKAKELLMKFEAGSLSKIKPEDYAAVIEACKA